MLSWYRTLAKFRREHRELTEGTYEELMPEDEQVFAFARTAGKRQIITVANFSLEEARLPAEFLKRQLLGTMPKGETKVLRPLETRIYEAVLE
ncbi:MAG: alpha-glucosidase C-terminal domain-containing protein [Selenomonadaceae bacterium]|nr:alpha-glucosidase C-terminal domain-containing protein [Selenomonadaceae bacterium]